LRFSFLPSPIAVSSSSSSSPVDLFRRLWPSVLADSSGCWVARAPPCRCGAGNESGLIELFGLRFNFSSDSILQYFRFDPRFRRLRLLSVWVAGPPVPIRERRRGYSWRRVARRSRQVSPPSDPAVHWFYHPEDRWFQAESSRCDLILWPRVTERSSPVVKSWVKVDSRPRSILILTADLVCGGCLSCF